MPPKKKIGKHIIKQEDEDEAIKKLKEKQSKQIQNYMKKLNAERKKTQSNKPLKNRHDNPNNVGNNAENEDSEDEGDFIPNAPLKMKKGVFGEDICITYELPKQKHKVDWLKDHISMAIFGASGTGKSYLLNSLIPLIDPSTLHDIIILSMVQNPGLYSAIKAYCVEKGIKFHFYSDPFNAMSGIEKIVEEKPSDKYGLVIADDFTQYSKSQDNVYVKLFTIISSQLRNYGFHNIFISQTPTNLPPRCLTNANVQILFRINDKYGIQRFKNNYTVNTNRDDFNELYKSIMNNEHSWLMFNKQNDVYRYLHNDGKDSKFEKIPPPKKNNLKDYKSDSDTESESEDEEEKKMKKYKNLIPILASHSKKYRG